MKNKLLQFYHHLPGPLRSVAASLRGYQLRSVRYGPETEGLAREALEREHWSADEWASWRRKRLAYILERAATRTPYYREQWAQRRRNGDQSSWERLENWPILEKEPLRKNSAAFVADDCRISAMELETTSGTTFKPLSIWWNRETTRTWYALVEARCRRWYGLARQDRWAHLGAKWIAPVEQRQPPFWVWNSAMQQLYMSSYHLAPDLVPHYLDALSRYRIKYIWGYPSSLYPLAIGALKQKRRDLKMAVAITDAEQLFDYQRHAISDAFQCHVCETYGMAELSAAASECPRGNLHLWPEVGWIEVVENGRVVPNGTSGELVCTGLLNAEMPLIRYRLGDRGIVPQSSAPCPCGRTLPVLTSLEGRADQVLYTVDARPIGRLCTVIQSNIAIREAQIIQESLKQVRVRYVSTSEFTSEGARAMTERIQACMGMVEVILEEVDRIPRGPNGKFKSVICNLSAEERRAVAARI